MLFFIWNFFICITFRLAYTSLNIKSYSSLYMLYGLSDKMFDVWNVVFYGSGILNLWDVGDVWILGMWDIGDVGCSGWGMLGMSYARDVGCLGCEMLGMWNVRDVVCSRCGMFGMWDARDVGCGMWDVYRDVGCWFTKCLVSKASS